MIENVASPLQSRHAVKYRRLFPRQRRVAIVESETVLMFHIVADKQVEMAVAIIVQEGSSSVPALFGLQEARFACGIGESAVSIVVVKDIPAVISNEQVEIAIIVIVPHANALPPTVSHQPSFFGDIRKGSIVIVSEKVIGRFRSFGKVAQPPTVDQEYIQPAVVVVIEKRHAPPCGGQKEVFSFMSENNRFGVQSSFLGHVNVLEP